MNTESNNLNKILFLDFDHTCYDTDTFLLQEIRHPMIKKFKIPTKEWEESYEKAVRVGYSLEQHLIELNKITDNGSCSKEEMESLGRTINFDKYLFKDVVPFLKKVKEKGYRIVLLSFGMPNWQDKKVLGVGLDKLVDVIKYTKKEGGKMEVLRELAINYEKVIFIDNNGIDLDAVHRVLPGVQTYYLSRVHDNLTNTEDAEYMRIRYMESRKIAERKLLFSHNHCMNLKNIILE
jgi:FMN phosphatase YigB (HAD superfamily)